MSFKVSNKLGLLFFLPFSQKYNIQPCLTLRLACAMLVSNHSLHSWGRLHSGMSCQSLKQAWTFVFSSFQSEIQHPALFDTALRLCKLRAWVVKVSSKLGLFQHPALVFKYCSSKAKLNSFYYGYFTNRTIFWETVCYFFCIGCIVLAPRFASAANFAHKSSNWNASIPLSDI